MPPECTCLLNQAGPQRAVLECGEAGCHAHLLSWLPWGQQLYPQDSGSFSRESPTPPPHPTHTHGTVRSPQEGAELEPPLNLSQLCRILAICPCQRDRKCLEAVPLYCIKFTYNQVLWEVKSSFAQRGEVPSPGMRKQTEGEDGFF